MRDPTILLFGYGALLHPSKIFDRQPAWTPACAPKHALSFRHRMGFGTLEPLGENSDSDGTSQHRSPGCAHGVVYRLTTEEVAELSRRERGYTMETIPVLPLDGEDITEAVAFISSRWNVLNQAVAPTRRYVDLIVGGAELRGLPEEYIKWLRVEQASALDTSGSGKPDRRYYATRGAFLSWSLAAVFAAGWVGAPLAELMSR